MADIANLLLLLTGVTGILAFAAAALNGKRKDGYNQILKNSNDALRAAAGDDKAQIAELESKLKLASDAAMAADKVRQAAIDIAQSRPAFEDLGVQMMKQHQELLGAIGEQTKQLTNLAKIISKERA